MKKILTITGLIFSILILVIILFYNLPKVLGILTKDISQVNKADLELKIEAVLDSENGFYNLEKISPLLYKPMQIGETTNVIGELYSGKNWDEKLAEEIVFGNRQALLEFSNAAQKKSFQNPAYNNIYNFTPDTPLPKINDWRTISQISIINSKLLMNQGKNVEAMEEALKSVKIGQRITNSNVTLIEYLVGTSMKNFGLDSIERIIMDSGFDENMLSKYSLELSEMYDTKSGLRSAFIIEHKMREYYIDLIVLDIEKSSQDLLDSEFLPIYINKFPHISKINIKNPYYYRPNKTKHLDANYTREQIKNLNLDCDDIRGISESEEHIPVNFIKFYLTENIIGKIIQDSIYSPMNSVYQKRCEVDAKLKKVIDLLE